MITGNLILLVGNDANASYVLETLHDIIVNYPMAAVESETADMRMVMERVGVLNSLYTALRQFTADIIDTDSLVCK